jgi:glycosyltransferase involved in cell wall biosynthesis
MVGENGRTEFPKSNAPVVSVIIPARNEERNLDRCLRSLVGQRGVPFEIIVVDDQSQDRTREIAESYLFQNNATWGEYLVGLRVSPSRSPLPNGWTGKANACWTGSQMAKGEWLLFTDADTEHLPDSLRTAVDEAMEHDAGLLSYSPEQALRGFGQMALMPIVFSELATTYKPSEISDPKSAAAAANGQYLLIRRDVYEMLGGHAAVASSLLEDVDLARLAKRSGAGLRFRMGRGVVRAHMYHGWNDMRDGWTKNLALLFPQPRILATRRAFELIALSAAVVCSLVSATLAMWPMAVVCMVAGALIAANALLRIRRAHFAWGESALALLGLPIFSWLLVRSSNAHARGQVAWKGRSYSGTATLGRAKESNPQRHSSQWQDPPGLVK